MNWIGKLALLLMLAGPAWADQQLTVAQVKQVIEATDNAAERKDTRGIGVHLGSNFFKYVDLAFDDVPLAVELNKEQYLEQIDLGWDKLESYRYKRQDTVINVSNDGKSAESYSTVIETFTIDSQEMVSKVREYATFEIEDGKPVITRVESITLTGDTTPE